MRRWIAAVVVLLGAAGSAEVLGAIQVRDFTTTGDGLITFDTDTGLEWLDITRTIRMSYNDVLIQTQTGGSLEGFRYATVLDLSTFWLNLGWSGTQSGERTLQDGQMALAAFELLGFMYPSEDVVDTTKELNGIVYEQDGRLDLIGMAQILYDTKDNGRGSAFYRDDQVSLNNPSYRWGSYLLRDSAEQPQPTVPEPTTLIIWSLLGGVSVAVRWGRRRKAA